MKLNKLFLDNKPKFNFLSETNQDFEIKFFFRQRINISNLILFSDNKSDRMDRDNSVRSHRRKTSSALFWRAFIKS